MSKFHQISGIIRKMGKNYYIIFLDLIVYILFSKLFG